MKRVCLPLAALARSTPFDGVESVITACPAIADAAGYTFRVPARVTAGDLVGQNDTPGTLGYLRLVGHTALLDAQGLVGSPPHSPRQSPRTDAVSIHRHHPPLGQPRPG